LCSVTCGRGVQQRHRQCLRDKPIQNNIAIFTSIRNKNASTTKSMGTAEATSTIIKNKIIDGGYINEKNYKHDNSNADDDDVDDDGEELKRNFYKKNFKTFSNGFYCEGYNIEQRECNMFECNTGKNLLLLFFNYYYYYYYYNVYCCYL